MTWTVRLRRHADGRIIESATYTDPGAAMAAYRTLLGRRDLDGQPLAAVFKPPAGPSGNHATFFSRFDGEVGAGRISPDDPRLDPAATREEADAIASSPPPARSPANRMTSEEFAAIRKRLGLTQAQLAQVLDYAHPVSVSLMERDSNPRPIPSHIARLMRAYDAGYRSSDWPVEGSR